MLVRIVFFEFVERTGQGQRGGRVGGLFALHGRSHDGMVGGELLEVFIVPVGAGLDVLDPLGQEVNCHHLDDARTPADCAAADPAPYWK